VPQRRGASGRDDPRFDHWDWKAAWLSPFTSLPHHALTLPLRRRVARLEEWKHSKALNAVKPCTRQAACNLWLEAAGKRKGIGLFPPFRISGPAGLPQRSMHVTVMDLKCRVPDISNGSGDGLS